MEPLGSSSVAEDCESPVDSEFERQTTRDSPSSADSDPDDLDLEVGF